MSFNRVILSSLLISTNTPYLPSSIISFKPVLELTITGNLFIIISSTTYPNSSCREGAIPISAIAYNSKSCSLRINPVKTICDQYGLAASKQCLKSPSPDIINRTSGISSCKNLKALINSITPFTGLSLPANINNLSLLPNPYFCLNCFTSSGVRSKYSSCKALGISTSFDSGILYNVRTVS